MEPAKQAMHIWIAQLQHKFVWIVVGAYLLAGFFPSLGNAMRHWEVAHIPHRPSPMVMTLPACLLSLLLFNAGLGVKSAELRNLCRYPWLLLAGLGVNLGYPILFITLIDFPLHLWHDADEVQNILLGMGVIAAMPIAGSSTAWVQNAGGNLALGLGLVLGSTLLSPWTTPFVLNIVSSLADGDYATHLRDLAAYGTTDFLIGFVVAPVTLGMLTRLILGESLAHVCKPLLLVANLAILALLLYCNASLTLPDVIKDPDPDFLLAILMLGTSMCLLAFATGGLIARICRAERAQATSLIFGLGMNNNGTGLVMATMGLAHYPRALLPLIFYNLIQHLVAGWIDHWRNQPELPLTS